ncbi:MAG: hypothetical protein ACREMS_01585 [Gemmatimonadaceae bacterium]
MKNVSIVTSLCAALVLSLAACGTDSTGPGNIDPADALRSLSLGLNGLSDIQSPGTTTFLGALDVMEPLLGQVNIAIDGKNTPMFALGARESFPAGTCVEDVFIDPSFPPVPGTCTPLSVGVVLVFWQSHSASAPPDQILVVAADVGTSNFDFLSDVPGEVPGLAILVEGNNLQNALLSSAGLLTTSVASTGVGCTIPLPPYAKSATCSIATFQEDGTFTMDPLDGGTTRTISISQQTIHGIWQAVTETQPVIISVTGSARGVDALRDGLVRGLAHLGR